MKSNARGRKVLFEDGRQGWVAEARLTDLDEERAGPPPPDPVGAAAFAWPHLWRPSSVDRLLAAPTESELRNEVESIRKAYGGVEVDYRDSQLTVAWTTEPVVLEGVRLGRFRPVLSVFLQPDEVDWELRVEALDPNPPTWDDNITHPHVLDEDLCLGLAHHDFVAAALSGRLADAADVIWSVLRTWSPTGCFSGGNLYTWNGHQCGNCGATYESSPSVCPECDGDMCDSCRVTTCEACDAELHRGCVIVCECGTYLCGSCECGCEEEEEEEEEEGEATDPTPQCPDCQRVPEGPPETDRRCLECYRRWFLSA